MVVCLIGFFWVFEVGFDRQWWSGFDQVFLGFRGARILRLDRRWLCGFDRVVLGFHGARYFQLDWRCGMGLIRFFWVFGVGFDRQWWCV